MIGRPYEVGAMKHCLLILMLTACLGAAPTSPSKLFELSETGKLPSGRSYSLVIEERPYSPRPGEPEDDGSRWGIDGGYPKSCIGNLELKLDGKSLPMVRKLYQDLSGVYKAEVREVGGEVELRLLGGDGAGSFEARYIWRPHEIERLLRHGEVPEAVWEKTIVHNSCPDVDCGGESAPSPAPTPAADQAAASKAR